MFFSVDGTVNRAVGAVDLVNVADVIARFLEADNLQEEVGIVARQFLPGERITGTAIVSRQTPVNAAPEQFAVLVQVIRPEADAQDV